MTESQTHEIDFRYAPADWQSTICFPDDPHKSLVGKHGDLRYEHPGVNQDFDRFGCVISFGLTGASSLGFISQFMEAPGIPIVTTLLGADRYRLKLTTFASQRKGEGRVDNVIIETEQLAGEEPLPSPCLRIVSSGIYTPGEQGTIGSSGRTLLRDGHVVLWSNREIEITSSGGETIVTCREISPLNKEGTAWFIRWFCDPPLPDIQPESHHDLLLHETREFWKGWKPYRTPVLWSLHNTESDFLVASSRNIQQSREQKGGRTLFQVGPSVYRGLWLVDGYFLLEAVRFLGMDAEAQVGLEALWQLQQPDGGFQAGAGEGHWKDTPAALLTLARQADLSQDWSYFTHQWPAAQAAVEYLIRLRDGCRNDGTPNGNYGLLPAGFGDSGIGGIRYELANSLWTLIGLNGLLDVATRLGLPGCDRIAVFAKELRQSFDTAASDSMQRHPEGFLFLPLLMKDDPGWSNPDPGLRIRPQAAQIYLSHALFSGQLFPPHDLIVRGHERLLRSILSEEIPSETGWLRQNAVWPYSAAIFAEGMLSLGERYFARSLFRGFLNHASPLHAWREEQSLKGIDPPVFIGDMPHNWASAECIRFLRNMLILESGASLHLMAGLLPSDAGSRQGIALESSPTKWGRVTVTLEPSGTRGWSMKYMRRDFDDARMAPLESVVLPARLFEAFRLERITGAGWKRSGIAIHVDPAAVGWVSEWKEE